jgi:hypothetical protein
MQSMTDPATQTRISQWIECRRRKANGDGASLFFLEIDLQSAEPLMFDWDPNARADRMKWIREVFGLLQLRLGQRAWGLSHDSLSSRAKEGLHVVSQFMQDAFHKHLADDRLKIEKAFDDFAAGLLRQECGSLEGQLRNSIACDADSAAIFFFAELAYALVEVSDESAAYWSLLLNCFVRAQAIYLARWSKDDPQSFEQYKGLVPPLPRIPEAITRLYQWVGDDGLRLETAFRCNLARVAATRTSFG